MPYPFAAGEILTAANLNAATVDKTAWTTYTPTLGGGWAIGTGGGATLTGAYSVTNGTVDFYISVLFGSAGAVAAATQPTLTLPVTALTGLPTVCSIDAAYIGPAGAITRGEGTFNTTTISLYAWNSSTTYLSYSAVTNTIPFAWAAGHQILVAGRYRKA